MFGVRPMTLFRLHPPRAPSFSLSPTDQGLRRGGTSTLTQHNTRKKIMDIDANSPSQMLSQIFGHQIDETAAHFNACNRNQYREVERFETEEELQQWMLSQGKKWGIVQKGRVTIEDIIDQYACVFRRRKGYACKVQMRVRHSRRNGHKVVEVLELDHDHTFYGYKTGFELGEGAQMFPSASTATSANQFCSQIADFPDVQQQQQEHQMSTQSNSQFANENDQDASGGGELFGLIKQEQFDLSTLMPSRDEVGGGDQQVQQQQQDDMSTLNTQPMELLLNNILNSAQQQQNRGIGLPFGGGEECGEGFEGAFGIDGGQMALVEQQNEALAERVAEKMAKFLTSQLEPKFASILSVLNSLSKSVDELKRNAAVQQQQRRLISVSSNGGGIGTGSSNKQTTSSTASTKIAFRPFPTNNVRYQLNNTQTSNVANLAMASRSLAQQQQHQLQQHQQQQQKAKAMNGYSDIGGGKVPTSADTKLFLPLNKELPKSLPLASSTNCGDNGNIKAQFSSSIPWATTKPSMNALEPPKLAKMGTVVMKNGCRRSTRKSVYAYRQRRRELSYRHMKEIGLTLVINGIPKSIFHCRVSDIANAVQTKRRELAQSGKKVFYRGRDVTDGLYRVECSRVMVNGRRCGQMIADSLWARGFFRQRMLMPILRGVSHRTKRRTDGTMREAVANDQFEVFKEALIRLGGFLMDEPDRYKWMETAREGVNQRGLDELANSKRAHFEFDGGPLFGEETVDGAEHSNFAKESAQMLSSKLFNASYSELPANILLAENGQNGEEEEGIEEMVDEEDPENEEEDELLEEEDDVEFVGEGQKKDT
uniref:FAR1 domain-containing protein n=1 Tax=Globodera rostochiensis TaxID=31243 RepID=A0A914HX79_GLORO